MKFGVIVFPGTWSDRDCFYVLGNALGMMPHPERAGEEVLGSTDGNLLWESILQAMSPAGR